jgi:hypothetical protein
MNLVRRFGAVKTISSAAAERLRGLLWSELGVAYGSSAVLRTTPPFV